MKIVINALSARYGGGKTYLWNLLDNIEERDDCQIYVLADRSLALPAKGNIQKVKIGRVACNPLSRSIWERFRLKSLLKSFQADVYFCPGGVLNVRPPDGCRAVVMFRNMLPFDVKERFRYGLGYMKVRNILLERLLLKSMKRADCVIFVSEYARAIIEQKIGIRLASAKTISHGVADCFKRPDTVEMSRPPWLPDGEYLLYVSFLELYKNQIEVIRAYSILRERRKTVEKLVLAGHYSSKYGRAVKREIARLNLENHVILTGTVAYEDLPALYRHAKINLFASSCENCPNIMLEAMAAGRPLLASNRQPMPEFGRDAVVYFDPHSPADIAEKIASVIDNERHLGDMSDRALTVAARYDWKSTARKTMEALLGS